MEKYIILVDNKECCIDLCCVFWCSNFYTVEITDPFDNTFFITEYYQQQSYAQAAKYILDRGSIISIIPVTEQHKINFLRIYLRIEEINRQVLKSKI
jgi:hypothetical protein